MKSTKELEELADEYLAGYLLTSDAIAELTQSLSNAKKKLELLDSRIAELHEEIALQKDRRSEFAHNLAATCAQLKR